MLKVKWRATAIALVLGTVGCALESDPRGSDPDTTGLDEVEGESGTSSTHKPQSEVLFTSNYSEKGTFEVIQDSAGTLRFVVSGRMGEDDPNEVGALVSASPIDTYLALHPEEQEAPADLTELAKRFPEPPSADEINAEEELEMVPPLLGAPAPVRAASVLQFITNLCRTLPYPGQFGVLLEYRPLACKYGAISSTASMWDYESIEQEVCYVSSTPLRASDRIYGYNESTTSTIFVYGSTGSSILFAPQKFAPFYFGIPPSSWAYSVLNLTNIKRTCVSGGGFDRHWLSLDPHGGLTVHRVTVKS